MTLLVAGAWPFTPPAEAATSASGFNVVSAVWGTATVPAEPAPGSQNVPLTITLQYYFYNTAQSITETLNLPPGFTDINGNNSTTVYVPGQVPSGAVFSLTFALDISPSAPLETYTFPITISWSAVTSEYPLQSVALVQNTYTSVALKGKVQLQFTAGEPALSPGTVNHVPIIITNTGTGNATDVSFTVTASASILSSSTVSVLNTPSEIPALSVNGSVISYLDVYVPQELAGTAVTLTVGGTYSNAYGNTVPITAAIGIYIQSLSSAPVTVTAVSPQLTPGSVNNVTLVITNVGQVALSQLTIGIVAPPSVSILGQFPQTISGLQAGSSVELGTRLFVSAGSSGSSVTITASVTYTVVLGNTGSLTQNLGFYVPISQSASIALSGYTYVPSLIYPGTTVASLQVSIVNSGTTTASNINATLIPSSPVYAISKGSLSRSLGFLPNGQTVTFSFMIGILNSSEPVNSTLNFILQYSGGKPLNFSIPFTEQSEANFQVVGISAPQMDSGDGADQIVVTLRNTGEAAAQGATFVMQSSYVFGPSTQGSFTTTPTTGVGTIAPGASTDLTVVVQVNSNLQPGTYPLVFLATWSQLGSTQPFNKDITLELPVHASVFQVANGVILNPIFLGALVILIALAVMVRRRRRKSRAQPTAKESSA